MTNISRYLFQLRDKVRQFKAVRELSSLTVESGQRYYCDCCGFNTIKEKGYYEICPICHWEDNYVQGENHFLGGGPNTESLYVAKVAYEEKKVARVGQFIRDPNYLTSEQVLATKWNQLREIIIRETESKYESSWDVLNYYMDHLYKRDLVFSRELFELIFRKDSMRNLWVKVARIYFSEFKDMKALEIKTFLKSECHNSWEELQELLNSLG